MEKKTTNAMGVFASYIYWPKVRCFWDLLVVRRLIQVYFRGCHFRGHVIFMNHCIIFEVESSTVVHFQLF